VRRPRPPAPQPILQFRMQTLLSPSSPKIRKVPQGCRPGPPHCLQKVSGCGPQGWHVIDFTRRLGAIQMPLRFNRWVEQSHPQLSCDMFGNAVCAARWPIWYRCCNDILLFSPPFLTSRRRTLNMSSTPEEGKVRVRVRWG
jgi:hypothetical protein